MPSRFTMLADTNVAATPMKADNPLKPPIIDGLIPETIPSIVGLKVEIQD